MANGTRPSYHPGLAYRFNPMLPSVGQAMELQQRQEEAERQRQAQQQQQIKENRAEFFDKMTAVDFETLNPELNKILVKKTQSFLDNAAQLKLLASRQNREQSPEEAIALERQRGALDGIYKSLKSFNESFQETAKQVNKNEQGIYNPIEVKNSLISVLEEVETEDGDVNLNATNSKALQDAVWGKLENFDLTQIGENHAEKINEMRVTKSGIYDDHYKDTEYTTKIVKHDDQGNPVMKDGMPVLEDSQEAVNFFLQNPTNKRIVELMKDENPDMTNREAYRQIMAPHIQYEEDVQRSDRSDSDRYVFGDKEKDSIVRERINTIQDVKEGKTEHITQLEGTRLSDGGIIERVDWNPDPDRIPPSKDASEFTEGALVTIKREDDDGNITREERLYDTTKPEVVNRLNALLNEAYGREAGSVTPEELRSYSKATNRFDELYSDKAAKEKRRQGGKSKPEEVDPNDPEELFND